MGLEQCLDGRTEVGVRPARLRQEGGDLRGRSLECLEEDLVGFQPPSARIVRGAPPAYVRSSLSGSGLEASIR